MHGLNGDILVWNPVTRRRHELSSMGIRVNPETLRQQLEITKQLDFLKLRCAVFRGFQIVAATFDEAANFTGAAPRVPRRESRQ